MIVIKILLLFLFCDNLIHIKAQLNKCITPEGNEGFCMNIWECRKEVKYLFSGTQTSAQTYNILKSVCDYTNSTIKLCCPSPSNTENRSMLQEPENVENLKVRENNSNQNENSDVYTNNKRIKRQDLFFFKKNTTCNDSNNNIEEIITSASNLNKNLELSELENNIEPITSRNNQYDASNVIPINGPIQENSGTEINQDESAEFTESSNINCKTNSIELIDNNGDLNDISSELYTPTKEDNEAFEFINLNRENNNYIQEMEYDYNYDSIDTPKINIPLELKVSMNSDNQIKNNTFIIINMRDKSTIFNNNNSSTVSFIPEDKNGNTASSSTNKCDKINTDLFKKILHVIFGKNYSLAAFPQENSDESLENNLNIFDATTNTEIIDTNTEIFDSSKDMEYISVELASEAGTSLENINSLELSSLEKQRENSSENSILQESIEIMNSSESNSENQTNSSENQTNSPENQTNSSENQTNNSENQTNNFENQTNSPENQTNNFENQIEISFENGNDYFISDESEEVYVSLPNPPHCGKNRKHTSKKDEFSWQVLLKEKNKKSTKDFCRGTLITRQHIVTTAYCIKNRQIESVLIRSQKISAYITLRIKEIKVHEHFEPHRIQNDIALIKLFAPIQLEEVSPICLKIDSHLTKNLTGIVAYSSGYVKNGSESIPKAEKLISHYECINELQDAENILDINENVLCAKSKASTENVCLGNEGSPLVIKGKSYGQIYYYQIGIVSEVNNCSTLNHLSIFVNINLYLNWLLKNM